MKPNPVIAVLLAALVTFASNSRAASDEVATVAGESLEQCAGHLDSDNRVIRLRAARSLSAFGTPAGKPLRDALGHEDAAVRFIAAESLGRLGGESLQESRDLLAKLATTPSQPLSVRMAAAYAMCAAGETKAYLPVLIEGIETDRRAAACTAADLIAALGPSASAATDALQQAYQEHRPGAKGGDYHIGGAANNALRSIRRQSTESKQGT
jgi:HEAT repeat protein